MSRLIGIITPNAADPDCTRQLENIRHLCCAVVVSRGQDAPKLFRANVFEEARDNDILVASRLEDFAKSSAELVLFIRQAFEGNLHMMTADGNFDTRIAGVRKATLASLATIKSYNSAQTTRLLSAAKAKGATLGRRNRYAESDWPRISGLLQTKSMSAVARDEGVAWTTLRAFHDRMTKNTS